uniref:Ubiquitin carboxyl-terminal hydrolase n=1 Tax=Macrostomum lignano TaxID=282301 RepID=A0A1I8FL49_9PLAT
PATRGRARLAKSPKHASSLVQLDNGIKIPTTQRLQCAKCADVYSYAEDNMVLDSKLEQHLKHFGIDLNAMRKVDKTMNELEIEANNARETGKALVPAGGPGLTGLRNLGNSCYINSVLQLLFAVPSFVAKGQQPEQPPKTGRSGSSLWYPAAELRTLVGRAPGVLNQAGSRTPSSSFSTCSPPWWSEAAAWLRPTTPARVFAFDVEDRLQCGQSGQVAYKSRRELSCHSHSLWMELALEIRAPRRLGKPSVLLNACEDFYSPATKAKGPASKQSRLASFTDYLLLHARKFTIDNNWCPKKLDVELDVPEFIDNPDFLRAVAGGGGPRPLVAQVRELGFSENGATRAVLATKGGGFGSRPQLGHGPQTRTSICPPQQLQQQQQKQKTAGFEPNPEALATIVSMGFTQEQASRALSQTDNNPERAAAQLPLPPLTTGALTDGPPSYRLLGFISHMGASTHSGHYVCHLRRNNVWYIFNDDKVCVSEEPPKHMGLFDNGAWHCTRFNLASQRDRNVTAVEFWNLRTYQRAKEGLAVSFYWHPAIIVGIFNSNRNSNSDWFLVLGLPGAKLQKPPSLADLLLGERVAGNQHAICRHLWRVTTAASGQQPRRLRAAVELGLRRSDLVMIHGPPGTARLPTVVEFVSAVVLLGANDCCAALRLIRPVDNLADALDCVRVRCVRLRHPPDSAVQ